MIRRSVQAADRTTPFKLQALTFLSGCVPATAAVFYSVDARLDAVHHVFLRMRPDANASYVDYFHRLDPFHPRRFADSRVPLVTLRDVADVGAYERSEYCARFFAPLGLLYETELYLRDAGRIVGGISLLRSRDAPDFADAELAFLRRAHAFVEESFRWCRQAPPAPAAPPELGLTAREREVAELIRRGASNAEIARALFIGLPTVKTHVQHILAKAGVRSRAELVARLSG
jgi:DNA-binding CsgD family transcriptional regulator